MDLVSLLNRHPGFSIASELDQAELTRFYHEHPMHSSGINLHYERLPSFFTFCHYQAELYFVFLVRNEKGIQGVGTLTLRPGHIHGEKTWVGYLGDLRVKPNKKVALAWRKFYEDLVRSSPQMPELKNCQHFYTGIMRDNKQALLNLTKKRPAFSYELIAPYQMVNVMFRLWSKESAYQIRRANIADREQIIQFLKNEHSKKDFGFDFEVEFDRRLNCWPKASFDQMILVFAGDLLIGFTMLWTPSPAKKIILTRLPFWLRFLTHILPLPKQNTELKCLYLTGLTIATLGKKQVLRAMVDFIWQEKLIEGYDALSFCLFPEEDSTDQSNDWALGLILSKTDLLLFSVCAEKKYQYSAAPAFEIGLV